MFAGLQSEMVRELHPDNRRMKREDFDIETRPAMATRLVIPVTVVAVVLAQTVFVSVWFGRRDDKLDTVIETVREIKASQYTQGDAAKDLALMHSEISEVRRRVEVLEQQRRQMAAALSDREDGFWSRTRWLGGSKARAK